MGFFSNDLLTLSSDIFSQSSTTLISESSFPSYSSLPTDLNQQISHSSSSYISTVATLENPDSSNLENFSTNSTSPNSSNFFSLLYSGIVNVVYGVIDPLTNTITNIVSRTVQAMALIRNPVSSAGIVENNQFNLTIQSSTQNQEGDFSFFSAIPFDGFLAQYWQYQYDVDTGAIAGQLINSQASTGLAVNGLTVNETLPGMPYIGFPSYAAMQEGSTITGTITANQLQVQITGLAPGLVASSYIFQITTNLQRIESIPVL